MVQKWFRNGLEILFTLGFRWFEFSIKVFQFCAHSLLVYLGFPASTWPAHIADTRGCKSFKDFSTTDKLVIQNPSIKKHTEIIKIKM